MEEHTQISSASIAATGMAILANVPRLIREPKHVIYAGFLAGLGGLAKYKLNLFETGFFQVVNATNSTSNQFFFDF
ncbi:unnamed protein product [Brachionus calyciflorus]|uniref:Uncharacterized protein n=1 Tax=Brachionus calyciflorus TaxID=104777 RepID=A0A813W248_9BILA|nr:unnamed protein product [Brachionus calyciflorus]